MSVKRAFVVGIAGGTGSGKTTLARLITDALGTAYIVYLDADAYYRDLSALPFKERCLVNFDHPDALDAHVLAQHIALLKAGRSIEKFCYDFATHSRTSHTVSLQPKPIVLVDGILIFAIPELLDLFDLKIFVEEEADMRLLRRIKRDMRERGRTIDDIADQYLRSVRPMHLQYVEPTRGRADIILRSDCRLDEVVAMLKRSLKTANFFLTSSASTD